MEAHQGHYHYPPAHDYDYDPRDQYSPSYQEEAHFSDPRRPKSPNSSIAASEGTPQTQQPLKNALHNAFDNSDSARTVDPNLIAQITAEVKRSVLDEIKLNGMGGTNQAPPPPPPTFPPSTTTFPPRNVYTPPSPKHADFSSRGSTSPVSPVFNPMFDGTGDTPTPRREHSAPINIPQDKTAPRPPPARMSTEETYTPIEKMWQRLFDLQGQPTPRLGQFLRGLAVHLIEDYEPKNSLVISPAKMLRFYDDVKLGEEIYPWSKIFGQLPDAALSKIYRDMRCQHHFIQERDTDQPHIPALTPDGFQEWMTVMILAYPSTEYERLAKAVLDMPISNADDRKERFPKELPQRLFPDHENLQAQQRCAAVLNAEGVGPLRRAPTFPPPPPMTQPSGISASFERERSPYASRPQEQAVESDDDHAEPLSRPIERERKPYSAAPGGGKIYKDEHSRSVPPEVTMNEQRRRTQSTTSQSQWVPPPNSSQPSQAPRTIPLANGRRPRSPSFSNYGTASDPNVRDIPAGYYNSNLYDPEEENQRFAKDAEMRRNEWSERHADGGHRRSTAGTDSSYDSQPRSVYDDEYYHSRNASNSYDNRGYDGNKGYDSRRY
ncbi:hypothetical protein CC80DRAFT_576189 [Byssothecium circinans]|uniref:DUF7514 domain-containing protein n=1 Tax=Byssothecium circinans TaxID=147558 RepID=A0A6A5TET1_9PLEO|nr:hypothetical protein CC80DRAFT_576189 [Byssothecium circinans]